MNSSEHFVPSKPHVGAVSPMQKLSVSKLHIFTLEYLGTTSSIPLLDKSLFNNNNNNNNIFKYSILIHL